LIASRALTFDGGKKMSLPLVENYDRIEFHEQEEEPDDE